MRVLFVTDQLRNGGSERQMALLVASLPPTHTAMVISLAGGPFVDALRDSGVPVEVFPRRYRFDVTPAARMWRAASAFRPDVVHAWGSMASLAMVPFCRRTGVPFVDATIQVGRLPSGPPPGGRGGMYLVPARWHGLAWADRVVANSRAGLVAFGIPETRGRVVHAGFDTSRLSLLPDSTEPSPHPSVTTVVMTARMSPEKDWSMLLRAARQLSATDNGRWRFIGIGEGPDRERLMREAADLVSSGVFVFPPSGIELLPDSELLALVASADIGVLLTNTRIAAEGCSNSILEYMACGLPVVCTDCGGNPELVDEGRTGHLVPSSDDKLLATRLSELRNDPARARSMGAAAARRARESFSVQAMVRSYLTVYDSVCSRQAAQPPISRRLPSGSRGL